MAHDSAPAPPRSAAVITASDGVSTGHRDDTSGDAVESMLREAGFDVMFREVVSDDRRRIAERLTTLTDAVALVVVTGGTGFGPRDVTPEAALDVIERQAPGLAEAMRAHGRASTPLADLSRAVCGARGTSLIVTLPGSPRGAQESLEAIIGIIPHALTLLAGSTAHHPPSDHSH